MKRFPYRNLARTRWYYSTVALVIKCVDNARGRFEAVLRKVKVIPARKVEPHFHFTPPEIDSSWVLPGVLNINAGHQFTVKAPHNFTEKYEELKATILNAYKADEGFVAMRIDDGELAFLTSNDTGGVVVGRRDFNMIHSTETRKHFADALKKSDIIGMSTRWHFREEFLRSNGLFEKETLFEYSYALLASGWLTKNLESLGLIGPAPKLNLVKELLRYQSYKDYIGRKSFDSYIEVPQRFAGDQTELLTEVVSEAICQSKARAYLVGMGIAKLAVLPEVAARTGTVLIDVGVGIDALAGLVDPGRQYFGEWVNFQIDDPKFYADGVLDHTGLGHFGNQRVLPRIQGESHLSILRHWY